MSKMQYQSFFILLLAIVAFNTIFAKKEKVKQEL